MASETITRPNGKPYQPRKGLRQVGWSYDTRGEECMPEVAVLGTHDIDRAREFAKPYELAYLSEGVRSWYRDGFYNGGRSWIYDAERGMACVIFEEIDDKPTGGDDE